MMDIFKGKVTRQDWIIVGIVIAVTALLFVLFFFLIYTQKQKAIAEQQKELKTVVAELDSARKISANISKLKDEAAEMKHLVELFEKKLPEEREIPELLSRFERLGGEIGLRVRLASLPTTATVNMETIPYRVSAFGQFHDIVFFINMLERDERYVKISDIDIKEEEDGISEATFILSTYRFIQREVDAQK